MYLSHAPFFKQKVSVTFVNPVVQVVNDSEGQAQLLRRGIEQVRWPGRLQWLFFRNRRILLDGSHNAEAGLQLRQFVEKSVLPSLRMEEMRNPTLVEREMWVQWVVGMLGHKDHSAYLRSILCPTYPPDAKGGLMSQDISFIEVKPNVGWLEPFPPTRLLVLPLLLPALWPEIHCAWTGGCTGGNTERSINQSPLLPGSTLS